MSDVMDIDQLLVPTILLLLAGYGGFFEDMLSCRFKKLVNTNLLFKQLVFLFIIYFTTSLSYNKNHPITNLKYTLLVWTLFIMVNRVHFETSIIVYVLFLLIFMLKNLKDYRGKKYDVYYDKIKNVLTFLLVFVLLVGFLFYLYDKQIEYADNFKVLDFIFGKHKCKSVV